jgi:2-dehydro-3-deoxygluconokinase
LLEDLIMQGGVDTSLVRWVPYDGVGREVRNGLNFTERGFGPRAALGCSDRGYTAASKLRPGELPWTLVFAEQGVRWLHTGGIFSALSATTPHVAMEAMGAARDAGTVVSYDFNFRRSLWQGTGSQAIQCELLDFVDVLFGSATDLALLLGASDSARFDAESTQTFAEACKRVVERYPRLRYIASTVRKVSSASLNSWGGLCYEVPSRRIVEVPPVDIQVLDRVGGGDSFASGFIYGLLQHEDPEWALRCGVAHGALAMSTPGDSTMATLREVRSFMGGESARIER